MKKIVFLLGLVLGWLTEGWGQGIQSCTPFRRNNTEALNCHVSLDSPLAANYQQEKRAVVLIEFVPDGSSTSCACTGSLINTTSMNKDSVYVLTASHCIQSQSEARSAVFTFKYEGYNQDVDVVRVQGSNLVATALDLDFTLLQISNSGLNSCFNEFYLGWDVTPAQSYLSWWRSYLSQVTEVEKMAGIHHPMGDDKKISLKRGLPYVGSFTKIRGSSNPCAKPSQFQSDAHWKIEDWTNGTTEPVSSGSPLLDWRKRTVGILSGISSHTCTQTASYQRIDKCWTNQLKRWLDPEKSNVLKLDGYNPQNLQWTAENSYEPNNGVASAEDVFPKLYTGFWGFLRSYIHTSSDNDYFKIKLAGRSRLKLTLRDKASGYDLKILAGNQVIDNVRNAGMANETEVFDCILENGQEVYAFIGNNGGNGSTSPYKLEVEVLACTDSYEPNEWYNQANFTAFPQNLGETAVMRTIQAPISDSDDEDWYAIGVDATGTLTLDLTDLPYDYNLQLYNLLGQPIATSATNGLANERVSKLHNQLQSTIYYARVYRVTNQFSVCEPYTLKLNWQPSTACVVPTPSVSTTAESAAGARDGAVRLTLTGGATPYTFSWNNGVTTQNISNLSGGRYTVTITTADGCRTTATATVPTTGSIAPYCDAITTLTSNSAIFSDGSGTADYAPFSDCRWLIQPINAQNITLNFTAFALGANDTVFVYDGNSIAAPLLSKFSSSLAPSPLVSSGGSLYIRFMTNATSQAAGWTARYSTSLLQATENLVGYEYWFDNSDNNRISRFFTPIASRSLDVRLNTEGLSYGLHTIHFRTKDENGVYSSVVSQFFTKEKPKEATPEMVYWEYWCDENYNDRVVEGFPYGENMVIDDYVLPPDSLKVGLHTLHAHFQDINGEWSSVISRFFYKSTPSISDNKIKAYRFWFDDAAQNMQTKAVNPPSDVVALDSLLNVSALGVGRHLIHFQHQDLNSVWSSVVTDTFFVYFQPLARFTYQNVNCTNGQVQFTNSSTEATSYLWRFGDGTTSNQAVPLKTYSNAGTYTVSLIATNGGGFIDSIGQQITVTNTSVTATITPTTMVTLCSKDSVQLTVNGGSTYRWSTGQTTPSVWIKQSGNYTVTVTNASGCTATASKNVTVVERPTVNFNFTVQGAKVTFNNLSTNATTYLWRFGNDTVSTLTNPVANYRNNGTYKVCLTANNSQNCTDSICKDVTLTKVSIQELPEGLKVRISPNPTNGFLQVDLQYFQPFQPKDKLIVTDLLGRQIVALTILNNSNTLDLSTFANGIYVLQLVLNNKLYTLEKIVKSD